MTARLEGLDVLRFVAVLLVMGRHMNFTPETTSFGPLRAFLAAWAHAGWIGVDLFFVLSGFLVSGLLFREFQRHGAVSFRRFFVRRGLKIYPAFYVLLVVFGAAEYFGGKNFRWAGMVAEALYVANYFKGIWGYTWSLAVEEHFYIALGLFAAIVAARRRTLAPVLALTVASVFCITAYRSWLVSTTPSPPWNISLMTHLRADGLMFGVGISYFFHFHADAFWHALRRARPLLAAVAVLPLVPMISGAETALTRGIGFSLAYVGFGALLCLTLSHGESKSRVWRGLSWLGAKSYSIYLWHLPVKKLCSALRRVLHLPSLVEIALFVVLSFAFGVLMAWLVEEPVLRIRDRLFPSRSPAMAGMSSGTATG